MEIINNIVSKYNDSLQNESNKINSELEISFHLVKDKDLYKKIFDYLKQESSTVIINEQIQIYYNTNDYTNVRITKQFKDGINLNKDIYLKKKSITKSYNGHLNSSKIKKYNIKLKTEEKLTEQEFKKLNLKDIKLVNIKLRLSFILKDKKFKIDLDLVNNVDLKQNNIKDLKNRLFKQYNLSNITDEINYDLFNELILETEFLNSNNIVKTDLDDTISFIHKIIDDTINYNYQDYIYLIAKFIITNKLYLENFKYKSGLKKLLNNVIEMNSELYVKNIQPQITSFYVTDKIDGQRCIIIYNEHNDLKNIKIITNKVYQLKEFNDDIKKNNYTILDSEFILSNNFKNDESISYNDIKLYIFDIIALNNNSTAHIPFESRFDLIKTGFDKIKHLNAECKEYVKLTNNYKKELQDFYNKKKNVKDYHIDGLIFTPSSTAINSSYKYQINSNYNNMIGYKWKPIDEITIDFYVKKLPKNLYSHYPYNTLNIKSNSHIYILFSGISKQDFDKLNLTYMANYNKIIPDEFISKNYFPIQFSTSDKPINYIFISTDNNLDNSICEFSYINDNWNLKKVRTDRTVELNRGEYFGNYFKIAELIWNNIRNPLTFEMLLSDNNNYFLIDDNQLYKALRSYNSFVKSYLLETIISSNLTDRNNTDWIIDLASGKGQDLGRINNLGFKNGIFLDNDKNALMELINRKFNLKSNKHKNMKIFTQEINLNSSYKDIIKSIDKFNVQKESIDVMICNFAIHYIISSDSNLINLIQLLQYYLKPNGRFIFTCFNGKKIFNLLQNSDTWNLYENDFMKYSIKKLYSSTNLTNTGQKIDVLLPFSNNTYYTEYLINLDYLNNVFNDNNFLTEVSESFSCLFDNFKTNKYHNLLSKQDKEFIDLYQFTIIKKNYNNNIIIKSNINKFFKCNINNSNITGSNSYSDNYYSINQLDNINNSNAILLIINTTNDTIINLIVNQFENFNYKNKNVYKRHRNKIIKVIASDSSDWFNIYNSYLTNNKLTFDSIIFYDYNFKLQDEMTYILIKHPIIPIILSSGNSHIIIFKPNDQLNDIKFISNTIINYSIINSIISSKSHLLTITNSKYYDLVN